MLSYKGHMCELSKIHNHKISQFRLPLNFGEISHFRKIAAISALFSPEISWALPIT